MIPRLQVLVALAWLLSLAGCGYRSGALIPPHVESVHVEMFDNETFRRELEIPLTRALKDEVARRTNLRLATAGAADSTLSGTITRVRARAIVYDQADEVLTQDITVHVRFEWRDARGRLLSSSTVSETVQRFAPRDETQADAVQAAIQDLAERIIEEMQEGF